MLGDSKNRGRAVWVLVLCVGAGTALAQEAWQRTYAGPGEDSFRFLRTASDGRLLAGGHTNSWGAGDDDVWLLKVDEEGALDWQISVGSADANELTSLAPTEDGGVVALIDRNTLVRVDGLGDIVWTRSIMGVDARAVSKLVADELVVVGHVAGGTSAWVGQIGPNGSLLDQVSFEFGDGFTGARSVVGDPLGGAYVAGYLVLPVPDAESVHRAWVLRLDEDLGGEWAWMYGRGTQDAQADFAAEPAADGGVFVATRSFHRLFAYSAWVHFDRSGAVVQGSEVTSDGCPDRLLPGLPLRDGGLVFVADGSGCPTPEWTRYTRLDASGARLWSKRGLHPSCELVDGRLGGLRNIDSDAAIYTLETVGRRPACTPIAHEDSHLAPGSVDPGEASSLPAVVTLTATLTDATLDVGPTHATVGEPCSPLPPPPEPSNVWEDPNVQPFVVTRQSESRLHLRWEDLWMDEFVLLRAPLSDPTSHRPFQCVTLSAETTIRIEEGRSESYLVVARRDGELSSTGRNSLGESRDLAAPCP